MAARGSEKRDLSLAVQDLQSLFDIKNPEHLPVQFKNNRIGNNPASRIAREIAQDLQSYLLPIKNRIAAPDLGHVQLNPTTRRGAGAVEQAGLENRSGGNSTVGSNPTLSATYSDCSRNACTGGQNNEPSWRRLGNNVVLESSGFIGAGSTW